MSKAGLKVLIDPDLKRELEDAAIYAGEPLSVFCENLLRSGLRGVWRAEMEY